MIKEYIKVITKNPLEIAEVCASISQFLSTCESLSNQERRIGGINYWPDSRHLILPESKETTFLSSPKRIQAILIGRLIACSLLLCVRNNRARQYSSGYILTSQIMLGPYTMNGADGADQMSGLMHGASFIGRTGRGTNKDLAVNFLASQTILSYLVSGAVKTLGDDWRNGRAVERVVRTHTYGDESLYKLLRSKPRIGEFLTHSTVALEAAFPLIVMKQKTRTLGLLGMGLFHIANAKIMGLGRFALTFLGTYPSISYSFKNWK